MWKESVSSSGRPDVEARARAAFFDSKSGADVISAELGACQVTYTYGSRPALASVLHFTYSAVTSFNHLFFAHLSLSR